MRVCDGQSWGSSEGHRQVANLHARELAGMWPSPGKGPQKMQSSCSAGSLVLRRSGRHLGPDEGRSLQRAELDSVWIMAAGYIHTSWSVVHIETGPELCTHILALGPSRDAHVLALQSM